MNKKRILIIIPPLVSPAMPSFTGAFAAGCFLHSAVNVKVYDASLDFFIHHIFSDKWVRHNFKMISRKKEQGLISDKTFIILEKIFQRLSFYSFTPDFFKSALFYDPRKYLATRNRIDDLLLLFSYTHYPSRIRWNLRSGHLYHDIPYEIYIPFFREKFEIKSGKSRFDTIILAIDSKSQVPAAGKIIKYIKDFFPEIEVIIIDNTARQKSRNISVADQKFFFGNPEPFIQWVNTSLHLEKQIFDIEPDFSKFPLKEYLTPELILPVDSCFFKDSFSFWQMAAILKNKYNAKGFLIKNLPKSFNSNDHAKQIKDLVFSVRTNMENQDCLFPGVNLIQWEGPWKKQSLDVKILWNFSRQGVWNHVELSPGLLPRNKNDLLRFISANPNIIHSYDNPLVSKSYNEADINGIDRKLQSYSNLCPLPGRPFWKLLSDPVHLLLYLKHQGKNNLFCLRADTATKRLIRLGKNICFYFKKPADLTSDFLDEICAMVDAGGSVDTKFVRYNLERAYLIGYAMENGILVGNSSLKHPRKEFIQRLGTITGLDFNYFVERGYTSVRPEYRALGVGSRLLEGLTHRAGHYKIFSIISEDNTATHKIAVKNKTKKIAVYYSEKAGKKLGVWMPVSMIEKNWNIKR